MIFLTGSNGFIGSALRNNLKHYKYKISIRGNETEIGDSHIVIHLAGIAHDLGNFYSTNDYITINSELTKRVFNSFLLSRAEVFIFLSSVKASADSVEGELYEDDEPTPQTIFGQSKLLAEQYILSQPIPEGKRVYILRPCMIHGPGNKGNLNLLFKIVSKNIAWPLGAFVNKRSFCSIDNLMFIFNELIDREDIPSGIYNVADNEPLSTNELIGLMAQSQNRNPKLWNISKKFIEGIAAIGDKLHLPLNTQRLQKLTSSYVVSNSKIKAAIGKPLPVSSREGLLKTFKSFNN